MTSLELDKAQANELAILLQKVLGDLSYEISDTDTRTFKDELKQRRDVLRSIAEMLDAPTT